MSAGMDSQGGMSESELGSYGGGSSRAQLRKNLSNVFMTNTVSLPPDMFHLHGGPTSGQVPTRRGMPMTANPSSTRPSSHKTNQGQGQGRIPATSLVDRINNFISQESLQAKMRKEEGL